MSTLVPSEAEPLRRARARAPVREDEAVPEFDALYRQWFRFTWSVLRRLGVPQPAIEDAAQEVWVIVHRRLDALESPRAVRSWLFQIARRVAARHRRGEQRSRRKLDALGQVPERPDLPHADRDSLLTVETLLGQLDARKREAFVLSELEGWSAPEIAKAAGTNPNTVYSRIRLAREELRAGWEARHPEADLELALADLREQSEPPKGAGKRCWLVLAPKLALGSGQAAVTGVAAVAMWKLALAGAAVLGLSAVGGTYVGRGRAGAPTEHAASHRSADDGSRERGGAASSGPAAPSSADATMSTPPTIAIATEDATATDAKASAVPTSAASASEDALARDGASAARSRRPTAPADPPSLDDETSLLGAAQTSLAAGEPTRALTQLAEHRERFASSPLADLRTLLELKALCAAGRQPEAEAALQRAETTMAGSALLPKMRRACAS